MEIEAYLSALLLGLIEGVTEFLPISSTGHLILATDMLGLATPPGRVMEVVIQFGAILAVCWCFRMRLYEVTIGVWAEKKSQRFVINILLAFLPSALIGLLLHSYIKEYLFSSTVVAAMLVVGGIIILLVERFKPSPRIIELDALTPKTALCIGFFQVLAMIPGTSRSGATIMGALLLGVERKTAAEFSFLLAIPTMFAAASYDLYKNYNMLTEENVIAIGAGFIMAFFAALLTVRALLSFLGRHGFGPFAWYRIGLGTLMLALIFA